MVAWKKYFIIQNVLGSGYNQENVKIRQREEEANERDTRKGGTYGTLALFRAK